MLQEAGNAMGFQVFLNLSSIEVRAGQLSKERTIQNLRAALDAGRAPTDCV